MTQDSFLTFGLILNIGQSVSSTSNIMAVIQFLTVKLIDTMLVVCGKKITSTDSTKICIKMLYYPRFQKIVLVLHDDLNAIFKNVFHTDKNKTFWVALNICNNVA